MTCFCTTLRCRVSGSGVPRATRLFAVWANHVLVFLEACRFARMGTNWGVGGGGETALRTRSDNRARKTHTDGKGSLPGQDSGAVGEALLYLPQQGNPPTAFRGRTLDRFCKHRRFIRTLILHHGRDATHTHTNTHDCPLLAMRSELSGVSRKASHATGMPRTCHDALFSIGLILLLSKRSSAS